HEHVPPEVIEAVLADGVPVHPGPAALLHAQAKSVMRRRPRELGIACPRWTAATTEQEVTAFGDQIGWPVIAKAPRGGYDGKGVRRIDSASQVADWLALVGEDGPLRQGVLLE